VCFSRGETSPTLKLEDLRGKHSPWEEGKRDSLQRVRYSISLLKKGKTTKKKRKGFGRKSVPPRAIFFHIKDRKGIGAGRGGIRREHKEEKPANREKGPTSKNHKLGDLPGKNRRFPESLHNP